MELFKMTAAELSELIQKKEISSVELTRSVLKRIEETEPKIKAFVTVTSELAVKMAKEADEKISRGEKVGALAGIPVAIKDNMCTKGTPTTCSSKILGNFIPPYDASIVEKLKESGAVIIGKTNMDEFAMGSSTEHSAFHITKNPWDLAAAPGGSSGGSAAAVAADETILATGSDTGGSIRQPASFCGTVGLKPTYGRVSRFGLIAYASSLDQIGTLTKDVRDTALLMNVLAGYDPKDSTSANVPVPDYLLSLSENIKGIKIGVPKEYFVDGMDREVEESVKAAIDKLASLGASVVEISLPHTEYAIATYYLNATAEASSNLARYDGAHYGYRSKSAENIIEMFSNSRAEGFGLEVKRRIMLGTYALSAGYYDAYYMKALKVRTLIKQDFEKAFEKVDIIATPTSPFPAFKIGEKTDDPIQMYLADIFTISINLAGIPGMNVPCGFTKNNLPIGLQLLAAPFDEPKILKAGYAYEQASQWRLRKPNL